MKSKILVYLFFILALSLVIILSGLYFYFDTKLKSLPPTSSSNQTEVVIQKSSPQIRGKTIEIDLLLLGELIKNLSEEVPNSKPVVTNFATYGASIDFVESQSLDTLPGVSLFRESVDSPYSFAVDRRSTGAGGPSEIEGVIYYDASLHSKPISEQEQILSDGVMLLILKHYQVDFNADRLDFGKYGDDMKYNKLVSIGS